MNSCITHGTSHTSANFGEPCNSVFSHTPHAAPVVSGPAVWVHHVWSVYRGRLLQSSSASLAVLALLVMPYAAALLPHLKAVARCRHPNVSSFNSDDPSWSHPLTLCLMHTIACSPVIHQISKHVISSHGSRSSNQSLSDFRIRHCLDGRHSTLVAHLGNPSKSTLRIQIG